MTDLFEHYISFNHVMSQYFISRRWTAGCLASSMSDADFSSVEYRLSGRTPEDRAFILKAYETAIQAAPSAQTVASIFSNAVLATITPDEDLTSTRKEMIESIAKVTETRALPTLLLANFVIAYLDQPSRVAQVLTGYLDTLDALEGKMSYSMHSSYKSLGLAGSKPTIVLGYTDTAAKAFMGIPDGDRSSVRIVVPGRQAPLRPGAEGSLMTDRLRESLPRADVTAMPERDAIDALRNGEFKSMIMGCEVISSLSPGTVEIVNAKNTNYVDAAAEAGTPLHVVSITHKLWPRVFYTNYRPVIVNERNTSILRGEDVKSILTEDGLYPSSEFASEYGQIFDGPNVPLASMRYCLPNSMQTFKDLGSEIEELINQLHTGDGSRKNWMGWARVVGSSMVNLAKESMLHPLRPSYLDTHTGTVIPIHTEEEA
jgi:hypothetical protein